MIFSLRPYAAYKASGVPWLGEVPAHWEVRRLKSLLAQPITDGPHLTPQFLGSGVPFLSVDGIQHGELVFKDCRYISAEDHAEFSKKAAPRRDDILLGKAASTGKIARVKVDSPFSIWSPLALIRADSRETQPAFLEYVLKDVAAQAQIETFCTLNTQKNISMDDIPKLRLALPPLPEQTVIVRFLDHADRRIRRYIRAKQKLVALLEEQRKNATQEAIRSPSTTRHRLEGVADLIKRPIERMSDERYTPIGLYNRGRGIFRKEPRSGNDLGDSDFFWVEEGDLVISGQFAWEGAIALASDTERGCVASHRYPILRGKPNVLDSGFLLAFFQTDQGQLLLDHHSRGAAGRNRPLNARTLMKEKIPLPPLQSQLRIVEMLRREAHVRQQAKNWSKLLSEYRTRLLADVVTGKLDVREAATALPEVDPLAAEDTPDEAIDTDAA